MGTFCYHGNQNFDSICTKSLCSLSPLPVMLHIKFDHDWPTGLKIYSSSNVWTATDGQTDGQNADHWYTKSSPCEMILRMNCLEILSVFMSYSSLLASITTTVFFIQKWVFTKIRDMPSFYVPDFTIKSKHRKSTTFNENV